MDNKNLNKLIKYLVYYKKDLIIVMASLLCVSMSLLMIGKGFKHLVDSHFSENYFSSINQSILFISFLIAFLSIGSFFRSYFINNIAEKIVNTIRQETYSNLINQEIINFEDLKIGDVISRLTSDIELISKFIVNFLSFFVRNLVMLLGSIALMFLESYKLTLIVIIAIPVLLFPLIKFGKYVRALSKKSLEAQSEIASNIAETITNIQAIHSFNQEHNNILNFNKKIISYLNLASKRLKIRALFFAVSIGVILISIIIVIWVGSLDIATRDLSAGQMISFLYYAIIAGVSSGGILELISEMHSPLAALERVFELKTYKITNLNRNAKAQEYELPFIVKSGPFNYKEQGAKPIYNRGATSDDVSERASFDYTLEFDNVSFTYPSRPELLVVSNISFKLSKKGFIGIVGRSGSGKSTLIQLLLKFYSPSSGIIKISGQDIRTMDTPYIREIIAYVPQEPAIFSGTIRSNIIFAKPEATEEEIMKVAEITGITEFIQNIKHGFDTEIGEKGIRLSGGQKQRISLARALLRNPKILLLDEAMSALDIASEQSLLASMKKIMQETIILSIAHRTSSIEGADQILVIEKGKLVAKGSHSKLLTNSEIYRDFAKSSEYIVN